MKASTIAWLCFAGCVAIWSTTWLAIAASTTRSATGAGAVRASLAALVLLLVCLGLRRTVAGPTRRQALQAQAAGAIFIGVNFALVYAAADLIPTHVAALLYATLPMQAALLGPLLTGADRLEPRVLLAALLGAVGVGVALESFRSFSGAGLVGSLLVVLAATASATGSSLARRFRALHPLWLNVHANLGGAAVLWVLWAATDRQDPLPTTPEALLATAYMVVVGSVLAFVLYFTLLRHWSAAKASYASLLASAGAMALGLLLGEPATPRVLLGGGLILLGAAAYLAKGLPWKRRPAHKEAPA